MWTCSCRGPVDAPVVSPGLSYQDILEYPSAVLALRRACVCVCVCVCVSVVCVGVGVHVSHRYLFLGNADVS